MANDDFEVKKGIYANNIKIGTDVNANTSVHFGTTDAIQLPVGNTGQRPATASDGQFRYNSETSSTEVYSSAAWGSVGGGSTIQLIDDITADFGGSNTTFTLLSSAVEVTPGSAVNLRVSINYILQPVAAYSVVANTIVFSEAPASTDLCDIVLLGGGSTVGVPGDGTITEAKLATGSVTLDKLAADSAIVQADDITAAFGGSNTTFTLLQSAVEVTPGSDAACIVLLNSVLQSTDAYTITANTIVFSSAPASTDTCSIRIIGYQTSIGVPNDLSVSYGKIQSATLEANVAANTSSTIPTTVAVKASSDAAYTNAVADSASWTAATTQVTTSGTTIDFTGIPAGTRIIYITFNDVGLSGSDHTLVQIGDSGGFETTGYDSSSADYAATFTSTTGFIIESNGASIRGIMTMIHMGSNIWVSACDVDSGAYPTHGGGNKTLSGELTQVRITRTGSDTFDEGSVNIVYQ